MTSPTMLALCGNMVPPGTLRDDDPPEFWERSNEQQVVHEGIVDAIFGEYEDKVPYSSHPMEVGDKIEWDELVKKHIADAWFGQLTGSCVGTNAWNVMLCQILVESLIKQTGETIDGQWWWPYTYGWGRFFGGLTSEGEGSWLSVQFKAFVEKGTPHLGDYAPPVNYVARNGARWLTTGTERRWSAQRNIPPELDEFAAKNRLLDGAMIRSIEAIDDAIWYGPIGMAGMFGSNRIFQREGVKLSEWSDRWAHNMGICGAWNHPVLGKLYKILNYSWLPSEYAWFWTTRDTLAKVVDDRATELMVVRDFDGIRKTRMSAEDIFKFILSL